MNWSAEEVAVNVLLVLLTGLVLLLLIFLLVGIPLQLRASDKCLAQGYPNARLTITGDTYCLTQEGVIRPIVVKQGD